MKEPTEAEEREWQDSVRMAGPGGMYWALVHLLMDRGIFTVDQLRDAVREEIGRQMTAKL